MKKNELTENVASDILFSIIEMKTVSFLIYG